MNGENNRFWLRIAPYWIGIVTCAGAIRLAAPGLVKIDGVMTSGSKDWNAHAATLIDGGTYLIVAAVVVVAGLTFLDLVRSAIDSEALLRGEPREPEVRGRLRIPQVPAPLPTSRDILLSFGVAPGLRSDAQIAPRLQESSNSQPQKH